MVKYIHFLNDTTLYLDIDPYTDHIYPIISDLNQAQTCINSNNSSLIVRKTNYTKTSNNNQTVKKNVSLSGQHITWTSHHVFLGVYIDGKLCSKVSQLSEVMRRISHLVPVVCLTEIVLYSYIFKIHLCKHYIGISIQLYYWSSRITNIRRNIFNNGSFTNESKVCLFRSCVWFFFCSVQSVYDQLWTKTWTLYSKTY